MTKKVTRKVLKNDHRNIQNLIAFLEMTQEEMFADGICEGKTFFSEQIDSLGRARRLVSKAIMKR